jgi:hypothetical protein
MQVDCLQQRIDYMERNLELHFSVFPVGTFYKIIGDNGNIWQTKQENHLKAFLRHDLPWNIMSTIWQTSFIKEKIKGFDESFPRLQDVEFHTRVLLESDIKYSIINDVSPECFYRIDNARSNKSHIQMLETMLSGVTLYIHKFEQLIQDSKVRKNLRGTLFSFLTQTNYYHVQSWISHQEYLSVVKQVNGIMNDSDLFPLKKKRFINMYNFLYQKGCWHIKGFNFIMKRFFIS